MTLGVMATSAWLAVPVGIGVALAWSAATAVSARRRARGRLYRDAPSSADRAPREARDRYASEPWGSWLERWLFISGFRTRRATVNFLLIEGAFVAVGTTLALLLTQSALVETGVA